MSRRMIAAALCGAACAGTIDGYAVVLSPDAIAAVFSDYTQPPVPGCAVGVFEKGKPLLMRGYGIADIGTKAPLDEATLFYAASTSKQFTALAIAMLVDEKKLGLRDDVRRWIPELPDYGTTITVEMLMHHTSGLGDYLTLFELAGFDRFNELNPGAVLAMVVRQQGVASTPGTKYSYSNTGFFLLAEIVKRVSGEPFADFVRERILEPLEMRDSFVRNGLNPPGAKVAHGYVLENGNYVAKDTYPAFGGSGGLMTSIRDLQKFDRDFQVEHRVWSSSVSKTMLTPGAFTVGKPVVPSDPQVQYAGGLEVGTRRGLRWVSHAGSAAAFKSEYVRLPDERLGIAVLCNRGDARPSEDAEKIIDTLGLGTLPGSWKTQTQETPTQDESAGSLTPALIDALQGRYQSDELGARYVFSKGDNGQLKVTVESEFASPAGAPPFGTLHMISGDALAGEGYTLKVIRGAGQIQQLLVGNVGMRALRFTRIP